MIGSILMTGSAFADWLEKKYLEWQMENGRASIRAFSKYLEVNHALVIQGMNAKWRPGPKTLPLIAAKLGYDVYDVLGLPRPDRKEIELLKKYRELPEGDQDALIDWIDEFLTSHGFQKIYDGLPFGNSVDNHTVRADDVDGGPDSP